MWVAHLYLLVTTTHNDGDLKIQITTPGGGATGYVQGIAYDAGIGATAGGAVDAACDVNYTAAVTTDPLYVTAYITTVTGGTVKLQWCQRTANGTTTLLTGSWLMAFRTDAL